MEFHRYDASRRDCIDLVCCISLDSAELWNCLLNYATDLIAFAGSRQEVNETATTT